MMAFRPRRNVICFLKRRGANAYKTSEAVLQRLQKKDASRNDEF